MAGELLTDADVADLAALAVEGQPDTCDIVRVTEEQTSGGTELVETTIASGVSCFYSEDLTDQDWATAEIRQIRISAKVYLPANQDIAADDRVTVMLRGSTLGTFEVTSVVRQSYEPQRLVYLTGPL